MVGKAKSISHTSNAIDYGKNKLEAQEISRYNIIGNSGVEIEREFKVYQNLNSNAKLNTISVVLSPSPEDGKKLSNEDFKDITESYLVKMGLNDHQHIAFVHRDREHSHIHIFVNRINSKGQAFNDSFIGKRTQFKAEEIAKEKGLISAKQKMYENIVNQKSKDSVKKIKDELFKIHKDVMLNNPRTFSNYIIMMGAKGLQVNPTLNSKGKLQGFRILELKSKMNFKASEIHRSMSVGNLLKQGITNDLSMQLNHNLKTSSKGYNVVSRGRGFVSKAKGFGFYKSGFKLPEEKMSMKEWIEHNKLLDDINMFVNLENIRYWDDLEKTNNNTSNEL